MAKWYAYSLAAWLVLKADRASPPDMDELRAHLEENCQIIQIKLIEWSDDGPVDEIEISVQLQNSFAESQVEDDDPTDEAIEELADELGSHLEAKYDVLSFKILDDALTSYLIDVFEDDE